MFPADMLTCYNNTHDNFIRMPCYNNTHDNFLAVLTKMDLQSRNVLTSGNCYINYTRPRLNPVCNYLLVCRNGKQILELTLLAVLFTRQMENTSTPVVMEQ